MPENDFHNGVARELGGIHENLKSIFNELKSMKEQMVIANGRTRKLEDWKLIVKTQTGVIAAVVSGIVALGAWVISLIK